MLLLRHPHIPVLLPRRHFKARGKDGCFCHGTNLSCRICMSPYRLSRVSTLSSIHFTFYFLFFYSFNTADPVALQSEADCDRSVPASPGAIDLLSGSPSPVRIPSLAWADERGASPLRFCQNISTVPSGPTSSVGASSAFRDRCADIIFQHLDEIETKTIISCLYVLTSSSWGHHPSQDLDCHHPHPLVPDLDLYLSLLSLLLFLLFFSGS